MDTLHAHPWPRPWSKIVAAIVFLAVACTRGSSGTSGELPQLDGEAPLALVRFPPEGSLTDAGEVTLAIAVSDASEVELVAARGIPATLGPDALWRVSVPLSTGINAIQVETRDRHGNRNAHAAVVSIRRGSALWIEPGAVACDLARGDVLVLDPRSRAVFRVEPSGARSRIPGPSPDSLSSPRDLDVLAAENAVVVTESQAVVQIDLATGALRIVSSPSVGSGPVPVDLQGIAVDLLGSRALVLDAGRAELLAVELGTGRRSTISSDARGTGPSLTSARRISIDYARHRALVTVGDTSSILAVDLGTGDRAVFSGGAAGSGPAFDTPADLSIDPLQDRVLVADPGLRTVFEVDLAYGVRRILSSPELGFGPDWSEPVGVSWRVGAGPVVVDRALDALFEVVGDDRVLLSGMTVGSGPAIERPAALARAPGGNLAIADQDALLGVRALDGGRFLVAGAQQGIGSAFAALAAVAPFPDSGTTVAVLDAGVPALVQVNWISGLRQTLSDARTGRGPAFSRPRGLAFGSTLPGALVADHPPGEPAVLLHVDTTTGERSILSDLLHGSGQDLVEPVALEIDPRPFSPRVFVLDAALHAVLAVELLTGDRERVLTLPALAGRPTDLAFDEGRERFLVTVVDPPGLLVGALDGAQATVLSDATHGRGPFLGNPVAVELVSEEGPRDAQGTPLAYVLDSARGCLLAVDLVTGERAIRTK